MISPSLVVKRYRRSFSSVANTVKIALCQIKVGSDKAVNINTAATAIVTACKGQAKLVVLPEIWNSPYATSSFPIYAENVPIIGQQPTKDSPSIEMLCAAARENQVWIVGGSVPEREIDSNGKERLYNTSIVVNSSGRIVAKHRKVHLFDIDIPGKMTFRESDSLTAGNSITTVPTPWGTIGVGICYDMRFPELAMIMRMQGCKLLIYPGAFNMVTGPAHWELLQRARAVDNQLYVATCSPARDDTSKGYIAWGHSSVVSPWGEVVANAGPYESVTFADLDFANVDTMRQNIPCWNQKRNDLYQLNSRL